MGWDPNNKERTSVALLGLGESWLRQDEEMTMSSHQERENVRHMVTEKIPLTLLPSPLGPVSKTKKCEVVF